MSNIVIKGEVMARVYLIIDESGDWGSSTERYFVIGGFLCSDPSRIRTVMKRAIFDCIKKFPKLKNLPEVKANKAPPIAKDYILRKLAKEKISVCYIVVDKNHVPDANRLGNAQNRFYNYQLALLAKYIRNGIELPQMQFLIDEKGCRVGSLNSFEDYLSIKLNFEEGLATDIRVKYGQSHKYYELQAADYICNAMWTRENYRENDYYSDLVTARIYCRLVFPKAVFGR